MASGRFVFSFLLVVLSLYSISAPVQAIDVLKCDEKADYAVSVSGVQISPYPVSRNKHTTFSISASAGDAISGGTLKIDVAYLGASVDTETYDLCGKTSCPVSVGDFIISHSQKLPWYTPPGTYTLTLEIKDGNGQILTCNKFDFSIGFWASEAVAAVADA